MGFEITYSAPPLLQGFAAYRGAQQVAERQSENQQAQIDAQNDAALNNAIASGLGSLGSAAASGYLINQAQTARSLDPTNINAGYTDLLAAQYFMGGPQAASGYIANQEQFRNRLAIQNDAQDFQSSERQLDRNFQTTEREARQRYRTSERTASQNFLLDEQIPAQSAARLGTTPAGVYDAGVAVIEARGENVANFSDEQIRGLGMQAVQNGNLVRNRNIAVDQARQTYAARNAGKRPRYSKAQQTQIKGLEEGLANLRFDDRFYDQGTGTPTPLGVRAEARLRAQLAQINTPIGYDESPPTLAQIAGWVPQDGGPPDPALGRVIASSPVYAQRELPSGSLETVWMQDGKLQRRLDRIEATQSVEWPQGKGLGEMWTDGGGVFTRNRFGEIERLSDASTAKTAGNAKFDDAESQWSKDFDNAPQVVGLDGDGKVAKREATLKERQIYADQKALLRNSRFGSVNSTQQPRDVLRAKAAIHSEMQSVNGNLPPEHHVDPMTVLKGSYQVGDATGVWSSTRRAELAKNMVDAGIIDESQVPAEIAGEYLQLTEAASSGTIPTDNLQVGETYRSGDGRFATYLGMENGKTKWQVVPPSRDELTAGHRYEIKKRDGSKYVATFDGEKFVDEQPVASEAARPVQRRFKKTPDGPTYIGDYNPATNQITNERLIDE